MKIIPSLSALMLLWLATAVPAQPWPVSQPEAQGLDSAALGLMSDRIRSGELGNIDAVAVVRHGVLVHQETYNGHDGGLLPVFSVTKSVGSVLMGMLVNDGLLDISRPHLEYFPEYQPVASPQGKSDLTVEHLLMQRHGYAWDEWSTDYEDPANPVSRVHSGPDWFRNMLDWPLSDAPGSRFAYCTGASTLMSGFIRNLTGMTTQDFAQQRLFQPLGIGQVHWESVGRNRQINGGFADWPFGTAPLGFGLWLTAPDMARIGQLYLDQGLWQGERLVPEAWVTASTASYSNGVTDPETFGDGGGGHGYQWWTGHMTDTTGRTFRMFYASGWGRQYILVFPELDLVVTTQAGDFDYEGPGIGAGLRQNILPSIASPEGFRTRLDASLNGSWYDPAQDGQGLNVEVLEDRGEVLVYWYTYQGSAGQAGEQRWFIAQGPIQQEAASLTIRATRGGRFAQPQQPDLTVWGQGELSFTSCSQGLFRFESESENVSADISLVRLTGADRCTTDAGQQAVR
ncbi:MAG: serine hydrolase [Xanthomonadales bacterium]|nr:serine hydrolase [Xanthomonadales bacterium]